MNLILGRRQSGKTTELIEMCHNNKYSLIVCPTRAMCRATFLMAEKMGKPIPMPITFEDFINTKGRHSKFIEHFYFDELQMSLGQLARGIPTTASIDTTDSEVVTLMR